MPVQFDVVWSTCYSRCILPVSPALSCHDVLIKYYNLSLYPRPHVPVPPSCVHRDIWDIMFRIIQCRLVAPQTVQELSDALIQIWIV